MHTKHLVGNGVYHFFRRLYLQAAFTWLTPGADATSRYIDSVLHLRNLKTIYGEDRTVIANKVKLALGDLRAALVTNITIVPYVGYRSTQFWEPPV